MSDQHDRKAASPVLAAINTAIEAMQRGAFDYIGKPLCPRHRDARDHAGNLAGFDLQNWKEQRFGRFTGDEAASGGEGTQLPQLVKNLLEQRSTNVYGEAVEYLERFVWLQVLQETEGNQSQAAEILGITRRKLRDRINAYQIKRKREVAVEG